MVSGVALPTLVYWAAASVIGFTLLPFAAREAEVAEQCREHEERDHRHRDRRTLAELAAGDAALEGQRCQQMGRVHRTAAGNGVDELEVSEGEDDRECHDDGEDRHHHREGDVTKSLPGSRTV